ncbi:MAG: hypothetical protein CME06_05975 [Gemmatimonadetes bacterium]|nr:hypothetical protein [Gemmatimonadota bacterium]
MIQEAFLLFAYLATGFAHAQETGPRSNRPTTSGEDWTVEIVETVSDPSDSFGIASLGIDTLGVPQVAYETWRGTDWDARTLLWKQKRDGAWQPSELISSEAPTPRGSPERTNYMPAIAVDASGAPHLTYRRRCRDGDPGCATYLYNVIEHATLGGSGEWIRNRVSEGLADQGSSTIQVSPKGIAFVAYRWKTTAANDNIGFVASLDPQGSEWHSPCDIVSAVGNQEHISSALTAGGFPVLTCTTGVPADDSGSKRIGLAISTKTTGSDSVCAFGDLVFLEENKTLLPLGAEIDHIDHSAVAVGGPLGSENRVHVVANGSNNSEATGIYYTFADQDFSSLDSWSTPELIVPDGRHPSISVDSRGAAWIVCQVLDHDIYPRTRVQVVNGYPGQWSEPVEIDSEAGHQRLEWYEPAIVIGRKDRIHVLFNRGMQQLRHAWLDLPIARR